MRHFFLAAFVLLEATHAAMATPSADLVAATPPTVATPKLTPVDDAPPRVVVEKYPDAGHELSLVPGTVFVNALDTDNATAATGDLVAFDVADVDLSRVGALGYIGLLLYMTFIAWNPGSQSFWMGDELAKA
ncbi:hypothetical protein DCS_03239 [Drechmeria coniospora]|uniref:Uncharacterized protein n=1 Tax=Drechmeria coniospora TaxID=98403 RepID=A0A151GYB9_DRECN|nr:hypothetical protein DCS_03239 [Drechmeria coniospora]KYK62094.1 hypothetical protein DCS_03239 [Drechmeria coniospora]